jgi:hypothetical protein
MNPKLRVAIVGAAGSSTTEDPLLLDGVAILPSVCIAHNAAYEGKWNTMANLGSELCKLGLDLDRVWVGPDSNITHFKIKIELITRLL